MSKQARAMALLVIENAELRAWVDRAKEAAPVERAHIRKEYAVMVEALEADLEEAHKRIAELEVPCTTGTVAKPDPERMEDALMGIDGVASYTMSCGRYSLRLADGATLRQVAADLKAVVYRYDQLSGLVWEWDKQTRRIRGFPPQEGEPIGVFIKWEDDS